MNKFILSGSLLLSAALCFMSCGGNTSKQLSDKLTGTWVAPVNGMPGLTEGMKLKDNGIAASVNMATLVYEKWETIRVDDKDALVLYGKSIGNGQTIEFADTLQIDKLDATTLTVSSGDYTRTYQKEK